MPEQDKLFEMSPAGENSGQVGETWKDAALRRDLQEFHDTPPDAFDHRDSGNYPQTTGQIRGETTEGLTPRQTSRRQNAFSSMVQIEASLEQAKLERQARGAQLEEERSKKVVEALRQSKDIKGS